MSFLEGVCETVLTAVGVDPDTAEEIGDVVSCGANLAMGNYAGAAADALDALQLDDDVPWLVRGLEMAGGDPVAMSLGLGGPPGLPPSGYGGANPNAPLGIASSLGIHLPVQG